MLRVSSASRESQKPVVKARVFSFPERTKDCLPWSGVFSDNLTNTFCSLNMFEVIKECIDAVARWAHAIFIASALFLFLPDKYLPYGVVAMREQYAAWAFLAGLFSLSVIIVQFVGWVKGQLDHRGASRRELDKFFTYLTQAEQEFLFSKYCIGETTFCLAEGDPKAAKLAAYGYTLFVGYDFKHIPAPGMFTLTPKTLNLFSMYSGRITKVLSRRYS